MAEENKELKEYKVLAEIWEKETENLARKCDGKTKSVKDFSKYVDELLDVINNQDVKIADLEKKVKYYEQQLSAMEKGVCDVCKVKDADYYEKQIEEQKEMIKEMYFLLRNYDKIFLGDRLLKCFEKVENYNFIKE